MNRNKHVEKSWGYELWFENNEKYCGKLLYIEKDKWSSKGAYHYHLEKLETFFVIEGQLILDYVENDEFKQIILNKYESFIVPQGMKHRFTALSPEGCKFIEASTTHMDSDSYRVRWSDEEMVWQPA